MATSTYVALATQTLANNTTTYVDFTSIPQGYTDLVVVCNITSYGGNGNYIYAQWGNGSIDTGTNYSTTVVTGTGSSAISSRWANRSNYNMDYYATPVTTEPSIRILNLMNYSNTTTYKTAISRAGRAGGGADATVGLWRSTAAINTLRITTDQNYFASGSTFTIYGIANVSAGAKATGGLIYSDSSYYYHLFTSNGTFTPSQSISADVLVVAGGGGGGGSYAGGGGAGGLLAFASQALTATGYSVTVGSGGSGGAQNVNGTNGVDSQFSTLTLVKGGGGGGNGTSGTSNDGLTGGSGGGAGRHVSSGTNAAGGSATSGQGNAGGTYIDSISGNVGAGGGGAGAPGGSQTSSGTIAGVGGAGTDTYSSWLTATLMGVNGYIAGGGGGGAFSGASAAGTGGVGGGANGGFGVSGASAIANTGGGGGGGGGNTSYAGGNGGSGLVIVRYAK